MVKIWNILFEHKLWFLDYPKHDTFIPSAAKPFCGSYPHYLYTEDGRHLLFNRESVYRDAGTYRAGIYMHQDMTNVL